MRAAYYEIDRRFYCVEDVDTIMEGLLVEKMDEIFVKATDISSFAIDLTRKARGSFGKDLWEDAFTKAKEALNGLKLTEIPKNSRIFYRKKVKSP